MTIRNIPEMSVLGAQAPRAHMGFAPMLVLTYSCIVLRVRKYLFCSEDNIRVLSNIVSVNGLTPRALYIVYIWLLFSFLRSSL